MRVDLDILEQWVKPDSRVLDLGCGDGSLLARLKNKNVTGYGLENDPEQIQLCVENGIGVIEKTLDRELDDFGDQSFDTVIMTFALQVMQHPDIILDEMLRVGRECIVTIPNFGNLQARIALMFGGKMPVTKRLPYEWYNTPNIHFCTVADFESFCRSRNYKVLNRKMISLSRLNQPLKDLWPNLFAETAVYHLTRQQPRI
ncbi:MAG: methionine biosynthesis protein MetW [Porticoccaceae bacterium]